MELVLLDDFISFKNLNHSASHLLLSLNPVSLPKTQAWWYKYIMLLNQSVCH